MILPHLLVFTCAVTLSSSHSYQKKDLVHLKTEVKSMFDHAYSSYLRYAYPFDELRSLSCDGFDTWGSFSLTLIDALDTLAVMGNFTEFRRVAEIISSRKNFEANINVSVFETNIRVVGGLLSAHLLSRKAGVKLEPGWPCNGPLLRLAEDMARRLLPAFDTPTGMPYGTVNLKYGVPEGETPITCTAGIGTFVLEFGTLSRLTGDPIYEEVAMNAVKALHFHRSKIGLVGNHVDVVTGHWTATDSGIGAGVDSYFEYLAKGTLLLQEPFLGNMFHEFRRAIETYVRKGDWHLWVSMNEGQVTLPVFQSLDAYWPGVLSLFGEIDDAMKSLHNYHKVWKQFGFTPEFYNIVQGEAGTNRESYPLRPELIESVMYLYRATKDPFLIQFGVDILRSLQHSAKTSCGYATINDVRDHKKADRMESFFLAETTKYLYLLFDTDNFIHNNGQVGEVVRTQWGQCVVDAGGYVFNTEAHPIDPGALSCCRPVQSLFNDRKSVMGRFVSATLQDDDSQENTVEIDRLIDIKLKEEEEKRRVQVVIDEENPGENATSDVEGSAVVVETEDETGGDAESESKEQARGPDPRNSTKTSQFEELLRKPFVPQALLEKIRRLNLYPRNSTLAGDYQVITCSAQPFLQRISIVGEFF
ncbi:ER degradation-enhancing alpha-mannosidase-like protein 2 isoform X1 [Fopius arisanus]|uniref:alpha-1,2-Mannosidase n=1 Tax=Fopius arisanus TaxID=64838 RepID=A0A9R1TUU6_9HYME|nr:PREDICTED: ER degradation-enhancing alpha-mannosidase-like protein 2 isoform X1 [Fopius arisanus]